MKKYITIAALLAAGTAFANAEDIIIPTGGDFCAGEFTFTFELTTDTLEALQAEVNSDIIAAYYAQENASGGYGTNAFTITADGAGSISLSLVRGNDLSNTTLDNNVTLATTHNTSTFKKVDSAETYLLTQVGTYTVKYLGGVNGSGAADLYFNNAKVAGFTGGDHCMNGGGTNNINPIYFQGNSSYSVTYVPPVPEPSAFGLLAGIGALALVASRRRRK